MKTLIIATALTLSVISSAYGAQRVEIPRNRSFGLKMSYNNTMTIEGVVRRQIDSKANTDEVTITLKCKKKFPVRGQPSNKAYQCDLVEVEAEAESTASTSSFPTLQ